MLAVTVGVPAPVDRDGDILDTNDFWRLVGIDARSELGARHGWHVQMENDANLAVLAERCWGDGQGLGDVVALLAGERFGAGVTESGRLLHGSRGGIGEMAYLDHVEGVGHAGGIVQVAVGWAREAIASGRETLLQGMCNGDPVRLSAEMVFAAADREDMVATEVIARLSLRLAKIVGTLASLLNPEVVIICGAVATSAATLIDDVTALLAATTETPPKLFASKLGDTVVSLGAVRHALDYVDRHALDIAPKAAVAGRQTGDRGRGRAGAGCHVRAGDLDR
ncbi:putative NBD/HSP70 family sugar kinase [Nakamurella sp. UYEF19]|uniref:ROK family protein n=1 Tax=Nakamurella sp. UYEF19 TaxID=1756392 RepID=UPI0033955311